MTNTTASISINMDNVVGKLEGELEVLLCEGYTRPLKSVFVDLWDSRVFNRDVKRYANNIVCDIMTLFNKSNMGKIVPWQMYAGPRVRFNDSAGRQLTIVFGHKGQLFVAPPGMEIQITNTGDTTPTTYYTAPQAPAPPALLAKPHGSVFPHSNKLTMGPNEIKALERMAGGITPFMTPTSDRSCGNCANYQFLNYTCSKSNRRNVDQNTQCFTDNFKSPEDRG